MYSFKFITSYKFNLAVDITKKNRTIFSSFSTPTFQPNLKSEVLNLPHSEKRNTLQNKPNVQRVMDLLQQLQRESRSSVDLPDLVQQLLKCSGAARQPQATFSKCRSFTEGTFPELEINQQREIVSQMRVKYQCILI